MTAVSRLLVLLVVALFLVAGVRPAAAGPSARARAAASAAAASAEEAPQPAADDRDRERILRLQSSLRDIVHLAFGRLKVGLRVIEAHSGRVFFGRGTGALMDPASNQKVLATTTALVRLGCDWRFRTEVYGEPPDADGVVRGDLFLRGSGDPTLSARELEELASRLVARGVTQVTGGVVADPRRVGDDRLPSSNDQSAQLAIERGVVAVRVRPGEVGQPPSVILDPAPPAGLPGIASDFVVINRARTFPGGQRRLAVEATAIKGVLRIDVAGRIGTENPGIVYRRRAGDGTLTAAIFFRAALGNAGISVRERATVGVSDVGTMLLAAHSSAPLSLLLRKINKDSDNYEAERLLEAVGAEVLGGPPSTEKGIAVLRDVIGDFGLDPRSYVPRNGSGLGHANRISARAMTDLLRAIYLDPRVGPELMQSLSVGGVDGTTRNRFRGTPVARHVRAKTGTLVGKSVLSGLVGEGDDVMAFSIMVQGFKTRSALSAVRGAQVAAVNMMMRYAQEKGGARVEAPAPALALSPTGTDYETGGDMNTDNEVPDETPATPERRPPPAETRPAGTVATRRLARAPDATVKAAPALAAKPLVNKAPEKEGAAANDPDAEAEDAAPEDDSTSLRSSLVSSARLGLGGAGSYSGNSTAPGARVFADLGGAGLGLAATVYGSDFHSLPGPGVGTSDWTRVAGTIGPRYRLMINELLSVDLNAALAVGRFWVHGHGYPVNASSATFALGASAGARLAWERGMLSPWLGLDAVAWPGQHKIEVENIVGTQQIPVMDLLVSIGASFRLW
jgi:PBP4 family serine-type D-alanyl-D-alanine carboxypeptidase